MNNTQRKAEEILKKLKGKAFVIDKKDPINIKYPITISDSTDLHICKSIVLYNGHILICPLKHVGIVSDVANLSPIEKAVFEKTKGVIYYEGTRFCPASPVDIISRLDSLLLSVAL